MSPGPGGLRGRRGAERQEQERGLEFPWTAPLLGGCHHNAASGGAVGLQGMLRLLGLQSCEEGSAP